jgi:3-methyl-2-oxobutanoate hydroxymethyltransferase
VAPGAAPGGDVIAAERAGSGTVTAALDAAGGRSHMPQDPHVAPLPGAGRITVPWVGEAPRRGERLVMVTAYDYAGGRQVDAAGVDVVLVGDSLAMVVLGHPDTLAVTVDEMLHHVKAVRRGVERALLVADMPYGSFHLSAAQAVENALRFLKEGGAQAVKIEGDRPEVVRALVAAEVPVMAHLGLTPQSVHKLGGFKVQGRGAEAGERLLAAARAAEAAGAFALVLECVPAPLAAEVSAALAIPTIGIGAGAACDGQVLVYHDLLGMEERIAPRFVRRYAQLGREAREAVAAFAADVRAGRFPSEAESYHDPSRAEAVGRLYG